MSPDSPYTQYWTMQATPEQTQNTLQWQALVSMRAAARAGGYANDLATKAQRHLEFLRWLYTNGKLTEFAG